MVMSSYAMLEGREVAMAEKTKAATPEQESALIRSALIVLLERVGGKMEYTQTEFAAVRGAHGAYVVTAKVDRSGPGEPVVRVAIEPAPGKASDPVM
jgi:hypothetical protein